MSLTTLRRACLAACAAAVLVAAAPSIALADSCAGADADPHAVPASTVQSATVCLLNETRAQHGLRALKSNAKLALAARRHAEDMASRKYFSHDSPGGANFIDRIVRTSYVRQNQPGWALGENLAWGSHELATPRAIMEAWMESPGHRANILNGRFREIGVGLALAAPVEGQDSAATYATEFGTRAASSSRRG